MQGTRPGSRSITALAAVVGFGLAAATGTAVFAHDEIESSVPAHQEILDAPISEVTIDFGEPVGGVELGLISPDDEQLPGEVTVISDTEAVLTFEELTEEGEYLVRYLAEEDGHLVAGAISFVYGSRAGSGADPMTWVVFGLVAVAILGVGAYFSVRRTRTTDPDGDGQVERDTGVTTA